MSVAIASQGLSRGAGMIAAARLLVGGSLHARGAIVLAYHDVSAEPGTDYQVCPELFRQQLVWARSWGTEFVPLAELTSAFLGGRNIDGLASVVFDDALAGVSRHAAPILRELGIPATIFVVSHRLGQSPEWWPGADRTMTTDELLSMVAGGHDVGSHTRTHPSLTDLDTASLDEELAGSRRDLEALVGHPVDLLAYPSGHFNPTVTHAAREAGYRAAFTFLNGRIEPGLDPYRIPRLNMWSGQSRARLAYHLARTARSWDDVQPEAAP